jgi:uncharacterized protein (TIGR03435 family)
MSSRTWLFLCVFAVLSAMVGRISAQKPTELTFDVASVKENTSGIVQTGGIMAGNRFSMINETFWRLVGEAYATSQSLPRYLIIGGPEWIDTDRFDVQGVAKSPMTTREARLMLRTLLEQRFMLRAHLETRQLPVYDLVLARTDGKLGPQLRQASAPCSARQTNSTEQSLQPAQAPSCVMGFGFGRLTANGMTLKELAAGLSRYVGRPALDRTGLAGPFDWTLIWTPDNLPQRAAGTPADQPLRVNGIIVDPNGPTLFTALQEQLGLELESTRGPVEVVVIDHVERPTAN